MGLLTNSILGFFGGLGIFLYGTHLLSNGLQRIAASKMREYLTQLTDTRLKGMLSGIVTTFFLQSSTVTSILVVGLVSTSAISMAQAFGVILGSAIGTTLTVQILTFNIATIAPLFIFLGTVFSVFLKHNTMRVVGLISLSIGFIFFGINLITTSVSPISEHGPVLNTLVTLSEIPVVFAILSMVLTALFHSSAAMIIIGIALVNSGVLSIHTVLPLVLGANVGSTIPVIVSSLTSSLEGRKLAFFTFFFKCTGVILAFIFLFYIWNPIELIPGTSERKIANFHTFFNLAIALIFLPLLPLVVKLFDYVFPKKTVEQMFTVKLDDKMLEVPEEALSSSKRQIVKLATVVFDDMIKRLSPYMEGKHEGNSLKQVEMIIDESYIKIQQYLLKLGQRDLTNSQSNQEVKLLNILNEIEHIGDTVIRFISMAEKVHDQKIELSEKDLQQLKELLTHIEQTYQNSLQAFKHDDHNIARETIQSQSLIYQFENDIKFEHFNSLINKHEYNPKISAVYLDITNQLLQVYHHSMNISRTVLGLI
ncbi:Na/Pi cotransporter family protein [Ornithinibacillus halophilus]|uniref:Phosphate:Na+ symporter n=1 Tax=Ornithinibacillus halophilus TaxID=930117 RepID=A0A1M5NYJ3_9BACI|nr:Na/Pi cotransporter family protein [Ornithinibacillus halophilus]SHG94636.1 phosphate:Na+ symporter [Ornithinibacillus halophilus]